MRETSSKGAHPTRDTRRSPNIWQVPIYWGILQAAADCERSETVTSSINPDGYLATVDNHSARLEFLGVFDSDR